MPAGFFAKSVLAQSKAPTLSLPMCGACGLYKRCQSPKMPVAGQGRKKILVVGEAPGETEDEKGEPFVGKTGKYLQRTLSQFGVKLREDCWLTNALICHPEDNRTPDEDEIEYCRPNVVSALQRLKPELVILCGGPATQSVIGHLWKAGEDFGGIGRWVGWQIPSQKLNAWVCPVWHPSYVVRQDHGRTDEVVELLWDEHLKSACDLAGSRPFGKLPNYEAQIELCLDAKRAAAVLREFISRGGVVAFDYETNMLKPDSSRSQIVSCAVCWQGKQTIAYPWHGEAIKATAELLQSDLWKVGSNIKFEERWTRRHLGFRVRRWLWDTMQGAHLWDNRKAVTSVKFQAFVLLGLETYDDHIKSLLESDNGNEPNQVIEEIDINDLLRYNGMDAVVEYKVARKQLELLGWQSKIQTRLSK